MAERERGYGESAAARSRSPGAGGHGGLFGNWLIEIVYAARGVSVPQARVRKYRDETEQSNSRICNHYQSRREYFLRYSTETVMAGV